MVEMRLLAVSLILGCTATATAQDIGQPPDPRRTAGVWAPADPNRPAFLSAYCRQPPPVEAPVKEGTRSGELPPFQDVSPNPIPGVIAAGQHWSVVLEDRGNGADGIVGFDDGSLWVALTSRSEVIRILSITHNFSALSGSRNDCWRWIWGAPSRVSRAGPARQPWRSLRPLDIETGHTHARGLRSALSGGLRWKERVRAM
jgi:hypothetical protein